MGIVHVVIDNDFFLGMKQPVQAARVLCQRPVPGDRHYGLFDEFRVKPSEADCWMINSLAIQAAHLNSALVGIVRLTLPEAVLRKRLVNAKYYSGVEVFLSENQLFNRVQADFGEGLWHATGLLRLTLAAQFLGAVERPDCPLRLQECAPTKMEGDSA
jgi:hypothetical protein